MTYDPIDTGPNDSNADGTWQSVTTEDIHDVIFVQPRATGGSGDGSGSPPASDPYTFDESFLTGFVGRVHFNEGRYITSGLAVDTSLDYEKSATYFTGDGVRTTEIEHEDGTSPTIDLSSTGSGNFGGVKNMSVFGAGEGTGTAAIIKADNSIIDRLFENLIVRYGGGNVLDIVGSGSGTRVRNCWFENAPGWGLFSAGGSRAKISNIHFSSINGGLRHKFSRSQVTNISVFGTNADEGIYVTNGGFNSFSNIYIERVASGKASFRAASQYNQIENLFIENGGGEGLWLATDNQVANNVYINGVQDQGIRVGGNDCVVTGAVVTDHGGGSGARGYRVTGDRCYVQGRLHQDTGTETNALWVGGNENVIRLAADLSVAWAPTVDTGATDNRIYWPGLNWSDMTDNGTRTVLNGVGLNAGDPSSAGDWNGNGWEGLFVWDTTNSEGYQFANGSWKTVKPDMTGLTAKDTGTVDGTYGTSEADVIKNNRTRIEEIENALK